jgi:RNA polymerase-binding protein DksA
LTKISKRPEDAAKVPMSPRIRLQRSRMPDLTSQQLSQLSRALDSRQQALLEEVRTELERSGEQHYIDLAGRVTDSGDQAVADMLADLDAEIIDRQVKELRDIDAAKERLRTGRYGDCTDCGQEVGFERLCAYPTAKRCIQCQSQREKGYAHGGTPRL